MALRKRTQLRGADGSVLGNIEPPPTVIKEFTQSWPDWFSRLFIYVGILNENFLTVEDWNTPTLINSWANVVGGTATAYYIDPFGRVWLKGTLDTGTTGTVAFTLPEGYRPSEGIWQTALQPGAAAGCMVNIQTDGDVALYYTGASIRIDGVSFRI